MTGVLKSPWSKVGELSQRKFVEDSRSEIKIDGVSGGWYKTATHRCRRAAAEGWWCRQVLGPATLGQ